MFKTLVVFPVTSISIERLILHAGSVSSRNGSSGACPLPHRRTTIGSSRIEKGTGSVKVTRIEKSMVFGVGLCKEVERRTREDLARIGWATCLATRALLYSFSDPNQLQRTWLGAMQCDAMRCDATRWQCKFGAVDGGSTYPGRLQCFHVFFRNPAFPLLLSLSAWDVYDLTELLSLSLWRSRLMRSSLFALTFLNGRMDSNEGMAVAMEIIRAYLPNIVRYPAD